MNYKSPMKNQNKGYAKESASQERSNLLSINPLSKHMSTPMQMGGSKSLTLPPTMMKSPCKKTEKQIERDLSINQIKDREDGDTQAANYEGKELGKVASGQQKR